MVCTGKVLGKTRVTYGVKYRLKWQSDKEIFFSLLPMSSNHALSQYTWECEVRYDIVDVETRTYIDIGNIHIYYKYNWLYKNKIDCLLVNFGVPQAL